MSRLDDWRYIRGLDRQVDPEDITAGRDAERAVRQLLAGRFDRRRASIFQSRRVPRDLSGKQRGRFEIDLIVLTPRQITAIEIKNWSGNLRIERGAWVQQRRNGTEIRHEDPVRKSREKLTALCALLERDGITLPPKRTSRVLFWNPALTLPAAQAASDDIVMRHQLDGFLSRQTARGQAERLVQSVLELCLRQEPGRDGPKPLSRGAFKAARARIARLESFDRLELHGGRVIAGDALALRTARHSYRLKKLENGTTVRVSCARNPILLFLNAFLGNRPLVSMSRPLHRMKLAPRDVVKFHAAGQKKPEEIEVARITRIIRG